MVAISILTAVILAFTPLLAIANPQSDPYEQCMFGCGTGFGLCLAEGGLESYGYCAESDTLCQNLCEVSPHPDDHN